MIQNVNLSYFSYVFFKNPKNNVILVNDSWLAAHQVWGAYISHNALGATRFRSCAVSGADWNPESGFNKLRVFCRKGNVFFHQSTSFLYKIATQFCSGGAAVVSCSPGASLKRLRCRLHGVVQHRLRFGALRLRSIRHTDCSLLHFSEEEPRRSELKPG